MQEEIKQGLRVVTLDDLKGQMRIDFEEDDAQILIYGIAAEDAIINMTRRSIDELIQENKRRSGIEDFPKMLYVAILILAAQLYKYREPVSGINQVTVPYTLEFMVKPWIRLV